MKSLHDYIKMVEAEERNAPLSEGIEPVESTPDEDTIGWWIVGENNKGQSGPYASRQEAQADAKYKQWFDPQTSDFVYGWVDGDHNFQDLEESVSEDTVVVVTPEQARLKQLAGLDEDQEDDVKIRAIHKQVEGIILDCGFKLRNRTNEIYGSRLAFVKVGSHADEAKLAEQLLTMLQAAGLKCKMKSNADFPLIIGDSWEVAARQGEVRLNTHMMVEPQTK